METQKTLAGEPKNKNVGKPPSIIKNNQRFETYKKEVIRDFRKISGQELLLIKGGEKNNTKKKGYEKEEISPTLTLELSHQWGRNFQCNLPIIGLTRRLTPLECERLQGFPDNFTKEGIDKNGKIIGISDTQRYKMCGNAVTTNVIKEIIKKWFIEEDAQEEK
jgi:DNA (cytosine-5)-methyltransferase 1